MNTPPSNTGARARRRTLTLLLAAFAALGACEHNPFAARDSDYAARVPRERLREIGGARIDEYRRPDAPPEDPGAAARRRFEGLASVDLSLEECRASALRHNLDLRVALVDPSIAGERVSQEEARFESAFTLRAGWRDLDTPTASQLSSAQSEFQFVEPGVRIPLRTGGTASVSLPLQRSEDDNPFSTLNPAYGSDLQLSISHELLRGAGRRANTAALRIEGYNTQVAEAQTKLEVIRQLAAVDRAYWRLYQARRELEVRQTQYELAQVQYERADRRVRSGASAEVEVLRAQSGVAQSLEAIIIAQNAILDRQRELKRIINMPGLTVETPTVLLLTTAPDPVEYGFDRGALLAQSLENRMELLALELQLASDAALIGFNKNQALPLLTLDYTYRVNGLGGTLDDSFSTLGENRFEDWELGLNAEIPLGNELARSRVREAILRRLQRLSTREARSLAIRQETLSAADAIDAGWQRILAARQAAVLSARVLQAEQRQFEVGARTSTEVLDAAARLADAQSSEVRALADYQIAQVDLAFATGTLLGAEKVRWEPAPRPRADEPTPREEVPSAPPSAQPADRVVEER